LEEIGDESEETVWEKCSTPNHALQKQDGVGYYSSFCYCEPHLPFSWVAIS